MDLREGEGSEKKIEKEIMSEFGYSTINKGDIEAR